MAEKLDLSPKIVNDRIENFISENKKTFDVIVSRAVTSIKQIWKWSRDLIKEDGAVFVIKGRDYEKELIKMDCTDIEILTTEPLPMVHIPETSGANALTAKNTRPPSVIRIQNFVGIGFEETRRCSLFDRRLVSPSILNISFVMIAILKNSGEPI